MAEIYDLSRALDQPGVLDGPPTGDPWRQAAGVAEISGACFAGQDVVVSTSAEVPDTDDLGPLGPCMLARWSTAQQRFTRAQQLEQTAGDLPGRPDCTGRGSRPRTAAALEFAHENVRPERPIRRAG